MAEQSIASLDLNRVADEINVILTDIYGGYVAKGSPTKLGGLRFLDVESSKTFAFEKTEVVEGGNLLVLSAPFRGSEEATRKALAKGPHGEDVRRVNVRGSADAGKADKRFVEVAYYVSTASWLGDDDIRKFAEERRLVSSRDAVAGLLKRNILPYAGKVMEYMIQIIRKQG